MGLGKLRNDLLRCVGASDYLVKVFSGHRVVRCAHPRDEIAERSLCRIWLDHKVACGQYARFGERGRKTTQPTACFQDSVKPDHQISLRASLRFLDPRQQVMADMYQRCQLS